MEHLIECVRRYPCLWNTTAIEYRDQELKDAAWAEVMKETDLSSVKEVKLKWKKLRDSYRDALKRQSETSAHPGKKGTAWKYTGQMQFLQPYMNNRKKQPEPPPPPPSVRAEHSEPEPDSDEDSESSVVAALQMSGPPPPAPVPAPPTGRGNKRARASSPDPLETFFSGMMQATRQLPFPAQLRIKRALFEAVAAGEEALLADHRRYAAAAAAFWPRHAAAAAPVSRHAAAAPAPPSSSSDDEAPDT